MKTKKWLWITLSTLLGLVLLAGAAMAGFRYGVTQSDAFVKMQETRMQQKLEEAPKVDGKNAAGFDPHAKFDRGYGRGRGGFSPLFGLVHLVILGALIWFGYKYAKNSGWRITREAQVAPAVIETPDVEKKKGKE